MRQGSRVAKATWHELRGASYAVNGLRRKTRDATSAPGDPETFPWTGFSPRAVFQTAPGPAEGPRKPKTGKNLRLDFFKTQDAWPRDRLPADFGPGGEAPTWIGALFSMPIGRIQLVREDLSEMGFGMISSLSKKLTRPG